MYSTVLTTNESLCVQLIGLQLAMAAVVYSLIEENGPKELAIAKVFVT